MRHARKLHVGDLLMYRTGAVCVVCCTRNNFYKLYYVDGETSFMANTPQELFTNMDWKFIKVARL